MSLFGTLGRGIAGFGRGLLTGLEDTAVSQATGGGLLNDVLGVNGQPVTFTPQQKRGLSMQLLQQIGSALAMGRTIGEGMQSFQQGAVGQIQANQQAQAMKQRQQQIAQFGQAWGAAQNDTERQRLFGQAVKLFGTEGAKQFAEGAKAFAPAQKKLKEQVVRIDPITNTPVVVSVMEDGEETRSSYAPDQTIQTLDLGNQVRRIDERTGQVIDSWDKSPTPGETMTDKRETANYGKPQAVSVPGQGLFAWSPTTPNQAAPITGPNGKQIVPQTAEGSNRGFTNSTELRKEFNTLAQPYNTVAQAHAKIMQAAKTPTAAGDLSLIYGYMKLLDPTSTVREGEFATAQNAGSIPDNVRSMYNKAIEGTRLSDNTRADFVNQANNIVDSLRPQLQAHIQRYQGIAQANGLPADQVVYDPFVQAAQTQLQAPAVKTYNPKTRRFE